MFVTLNATGVGHGDVVSDVDAGTGGASTKPVNGSSVVAIGIPVLAAALGVDEGSVRDLVAVPDGPDRLTLMFLLARPPGDAVNASTGTGGPKPGPVGAESPTAAPSSTTSVLNTSPSDSETSGQATQTVIQSATAAPAAAMNISHTRSTGLSDDSIVGRLVVGLRPWASQVTVERAAGTPL